GVPYPTGLAALDDLGFAIGSWDGLDDARLRERFRLLWFCIDKAGTGGGLFRGLWASGLRRLSEVLSDPQLRRLGDLYAELAAEWSTLATDGLRPEPRQTLRTAAARVAHIARLEKEGARGLAAWSRPRLSNTPATKEAA